MVKKFALATLMFTALCGSAYAVECPGEMKSCKVLILSDEQAAVLKQLVTTTGAQGSYVQVKQVVDMFTKIIDEAPAGEAKKAEAPPARTQSK